MVVGIRDGVKRNCDLSVIHRISQKTQRLPGNTSSGVLSVLFMNIPVCGKREDLYL